MPDPTFEKTATGYRIAWGAKELPIAPAMFENLYFAVPLNTTGFYRLLVDDCCRNDAQRVILKEMMDGATSGRNKALEILMKEIAALPEPGSA